MKKLLIITLGLLVVGCGDKKIINPTLQDSYEIGYAELKEKDYDDAAESFLAAEENSPTSAWAPDALIMAAYSQYKNDDFTDSLITTDRFMRFFPGHSDIAYVLYLRGMSYYRQVSDVRREPGMSTYALQTFTQLVERFPNSEYAENARNKIIILKNYIAGKVMYSARHDMSKENWPSAITRLQSVVSGASETQMTPEALFRLTEAYTAIGIPDQANGFAEMLRINYPDNEWTKKL